jgi:hypothetical protein
VLRCVVLCCALNKKRMMDNVQKHNNCMYNLLKLVIIGLFVPFKLPILIVKNVEISFYIECILLLDRAHLIAVFRLRNYKKYIGSTV